MRWNRFRSDVHDVARQQGSRIENLSARIWRYCAAFEAEMTAHLLKIFVSDAVPRTKPIIRTRKVEL
jgi:hypothetical protein